MYSQSTYKKFGSSKKSNTSTHTHPMIFLYSLQKAKPKINILSLPKKKKKKRKKPTSPTSNSCSLMLPSKHPSSILTPYLMHLIPSQILPHPSHPIPFSKPRRKHAPCCNFLFLPYHHHNSRLQDPLLLIIIHLNKPRPPIFRENIPYLSEIHAHGFSSNRES